MPAMTWWQRIHRILTPQRKSYAWIAGGGLWLAWLVSVLLGPGNLDLAGQVVGTDYIQFYAAGLTLSQGQNERLFDLEYQNQLEQSIGGAALSGHHAFITPPFLAWLFVPFAQLPYGWSFAAWSMLGLLGLWFSIRWLAQPHPKVAFWWGLSWFPVFAAISFGQNSLLSLVIFSLSYYLWRRDRKLAAGLVFSLVLYKPQLALGLGLLWLLQWRQDWKALLGLALGGSALAGLSFWATPTASLAYIDFARKVLPIMITLDGFPLWHAHALRTFFYLLLPGQITLSEILALILTAAGIFFFIRTWRHLRQEPALVFAAAICLTVLITPHIMIYDWVLLLAPAVLLWQERPGLRRLWTGIFAVLWIVAFISGPLTFGMLRILPAAIQVSVPAYILMLFSAYHALNRSPAE